MASRSKTFTNESNPALQGDVLTSWYSEHKKDDQLVSTVETVVKPDVQAQEASRYNFKREKRTKSKKIMLLLYPEDYNNIKEAAHAAGVSMNEWATVILGTEAKNALNI